MNKHKINLGYILRKYRSKLGIDIDKLSHKITTDVSYIVALEKGDYKIFTSFNQALPILRKLSYVLGLKYKSLLELYNKEYEYYINNIKHKNNHKKLVINYNIFKFVVVSMIGIVILGYLTLQVYQITYSPAIKLDSDNLYQFYNQEEYKLTGNLVRASQLTLNGQKVTIREDGNFEVILNLREGENRIELIAQKDSKSVKNLQKTIYRQ
jgi:cytoskeletal protein RodZ